MKKLFIIFAILCLAVPAMAADWNFYGSARIATWWTDNDTGFDGAQADDQDVTWGQQANSRIGATVKFNDQIGGAFEMSDSFGKRKLYGTYTMGNGAELLFGQTYTPSSSYFYSNSVYATDGDLLGVGQFYVGRVPMVQFKMGGLKVALIQPTDGPTVVSGDNDDAYWAIYDPALNGGDGGIDFLGQAKAKDINKAVADAVKAGTLSKEVASTLYQTIPATGAFEVKDTDHELPKIEVAYKFKTDMFFVDAFGGYQTYTLDGGVKDYDIDSYVLGLGGGLNFGAVYLNAGVHFGENLANYGAAGFLGPDNLSATAAAAVTKLEIGAAGYDEANDKIIDNEGLGYLAVLGFNASEMLTIEAGYGHMEYEDDAPGAKTDSADQYYVNAVITIAPGFFIVPEIGMVEWELDDADYNDFMYYGAKWQVNF